ncbi:hypothetical protein BV898_09497 [Hypsibius exemplaris]|uniref:Uncharacterized protein n=1 Tax=Hypsibius exemplaris TaxID=2072580 RepID=A0A1W0WMF0_HYPEX|nr:hypothetical protein BV898_09497 [Hypsibius exemplaris]
MNSTAGIIALMYIITIIHPACSATQSPFSQQMTSTTSFQTKRPDRLRFLLDLGRKLGIQQHFPVAAATKNGHAVGQHSSIHTHDAEDYEKIFLTRSRFGFGIG